MPDPNVAPEPPSDTSAPTVVMASPHVAGRMNFDRVKIAPSAVAVPEAIEFFHVLAYPHIRTHRARVKGDFEGQ